MTHRYTPKYRPPGFATVPKGWRLVERGRMVDAAPLRTDLPRGDHPFGVIEYDAPLTPEQLLAFELEPAP